MLGPLRAAGFQIEFHLHAEAILNVGFAEVADQLEIMPGDGNHPHRGNHRLRRALHDHGWRKHKGQSTAFSGNRPRPSLPPSLRNSYQMMLLL